jgi:signal transduction histidine kinase
MSRPLTLLLVEDSEDDAELVLYELRRQGFAPNATRVETGSQLEQELARGGWHLVVSDHNLPTFSSAEALRIVKQRAPDIPFIVVSGSIGEEYAVEAMRAGASDFVIKTKLHRLAPAVERELREADQRLEQQRTAAALVESEERLRQAQKLEAVGRLAGGVAHDFNNLLTAILGYADLALSSFPPGTPTRSDLEEIKLAGQRAVDLTRQLLAFSRQQVLHRRVLNLGEVVDNVARLLRRVIGEDIAIEISAREGLWSVMADRTQIEQIVMNLAVNARDAMQNGGRLRIETSNYSTTADTSGDVPSRPGDYVKLRVVDTGEGIPPEIRSRIFEPFFTTKEAGRGTGLGLSTVYGIVQQSEGFIFLDSVVNQGTTFTIYLPRTTEVALPDAPAPSAAAHKAAGEETILLVEDEASVRDLASRVLSTAGYRVMSAAGPQAALRTASSYPEFIHLLVTDVVMPDMSGPALAERLRKARPNLDVLFISGFSGESITAIEPFGENRLLPKPFTPDGLVARVREILHQTRV